MNPLLFIGIVAIILSQLVGAGIEYGMAGVTIQQSSGACNYFHFDLLHQGTVWHYIYHYWEFCLGSGLSIDFWPANGTNWTTY